MTIPFYGSDVGLFDLQGEAFHAQKFLETVLNTTVPVEILATINKFEGATNTLDLAKTIEGLATNVDTLKTSGSSTFSALKTYAENLLIAMADADSPLSSKTVENALIELIAQMEANSASVDASTVTATVTAGSGNNSDAQFVVSVKRGDGLVTENAYAETVAISVLSASSPETASLLCEGEAAASSLLAVDWPKGSGTTQTLSAVSATSSLLLNGDFEDEDDVSNAPDDWIVSVGTIGTTVLMTNVEVQTLAVSGSPSAGHYRLNLYDASGKVQTTIPIAYNASASTVQSAIRKLTGFELVTVSATGTSPNFTHTITYSGVGGNLTQLTATNNTTGGTLTPGTTSAGDANVFVGGKALVLDSDGAELTTLNQQVSLSSATQYAFSMWALADVVPAAGVITIDLVDGIGGTVLVDDQTTSNSYTFNASSLTTSWQNVNSLTSTPVVFRTPVVLPDVVYLRIRISTAVSSGTSVYLDHSALTQMTELYAGGPWVSVFSGSSDIGDEDTWDLVVTNDREGELQEWYNRNFDMSALGLLLPSNAAGSETIPDTVVTPVETYQLFEIVN